MSFRTPNWYYESPEYYEPYEDEEIDEELTIEEEDE